jgi:cellulose synthase/poly-beta-1,6-N-acetylglucosamine synthase-like glycosyltransferase
MLAKLHLILAGPGPNPFEGLYRFNSFDLAILIPYLIVLLILSLYGIHRCWLVYTYMKCRHNVPSKASDPFEWPAVTIQLPIYNERYVIERLLNAVSRLNYPRALLDIQVLDDSTDETQQVAHACVKRYEARGLPIRYLHRNNRTGFKAGALAEGLHSATGELVAIFDADFLPTPDFLRRTIPYFKDPKVGVVQTRWTYVNRGYSDLTEVETLMQDGHFVIEQGARSRSGVFFNFNGTAGVWRRAAIVDAGGWQNDTLTEDTDLSYRAQMRGWQFLYLPDVECPSELPVEMNAFKAQQARWSKGLIQTAKKIMPQILRSNVPVRVKAEAFFHLTAGISSPLMVVFSALLLPASIVRLNQGWFQSTLTDLPGILSSFSIAAFYMASQRALYPHGWKRSMLRLPLMIALGIGLSLSNAKAVLEALFGVKSDFVRTPKYNISGRSGSWHGKQYKKRGGWMPYLEIAFGLYFSYVFVFMILDKNYRTAPFMLLFVWGFLYIGVMSAAQRWWEPIRVGAASAASAEAQSTAVASVLSPLPRGSETLTFLDSAPAVEGGESVSI